MKHERNIALAAIVVLIFSLFCSPLFAQTRLLRFPAVHGDKVFRQRCFGYLAIGIAAPSREGAVRANRQAEVGAGRHKPVRPRGHEALAVHVLSPGHDCAVGS